MYTYIKHNTKDPYSKNSWKWLLIIITKKGLVFAPLAQLVRAPDLWRHGGKLATHCSQAIEIVSSNLTASTKSGGSVFEPRAEHQYGLLVKRLRHLSFTEVTWVRLPYRSPLAQGSASYWGSEQYITWDFFNCMLRANYMQLPKWMKVIVWQVMVFLSKLKTPLIRWRSVIDSAIDL